VTSLNGLTDVTIAAPASGHLLVRDATDFKNRALAAGDVPNLDASKINSGEFADARIPNLATSKITSGVFDVARIPNLAASKITTGTFGAGNYTFPADVNVGGDVLATGDVQSSVSDRRLKESVEPLTDALARVLRLHGVSYEWTPEARELCEALGAERRVGLIAQDVQSVLPEAVGAAPFDRDEIGRSKSGQHYQTYRDGPVVALLVEAVKELAAEVAALRESR
jgi:hypothetical protein